LLINLESEGTGFQDGQLDAFVAVYGKAPVLDADGVPVADGEDAGQLVSA